MTPRMNALLPKARPSCQLRFMSDAGTNAIGKRKNSVCGKYQVSCRRNRYLKTKNVGLTELRLMNGGNKRFASDLINHAA